MILPDFTCNDDFPVAFLFALGIGTNAGSGGNIMSLRLLMLGLRLFEGASEVGFEIKTPCGVWVGLLAVCVVAADVFSSKETVSV